MGWGMLALKSHHYQEGSASKLYLKRIYITLSPVHNTNEAQKKSSFYFFFSFFLCLEDCRLRCFVVHDTKRRQILHCRWFCLKKEKEKKRKKEKYYTEFEICVKAINLVHHLETFFFLSFVKKHFKVWSLGTSPPVTNHKKQSQEHPYTIYSCMYSLWTNIMPSPVPLEIRWIFKSPSYPCHPYFKPLMWFIQILRITSLYYIIWIQNRAK